MDNVITILKGITLILSSLFVLGVADTSWGELPAWGLFIVGLVVCLVGFHNYKIDKE
ncbi:MAG: hypothetical protein IJP15_03435 [Oscillospiraceae bacterium]|nr:hypothetical protein [Oscillospiraceae bacterium]